MALLTSVLLLAIASHHQPPPGKIYVATENKDMLIGSLKWQITGPDKKEVGKGEKKVFLKDVRIRDMGNGILSKEVPLSDHFVLQLPLVLEFSKSETSGFALNLGRDDDSSLFSWEWFNVDALQAVKLQGGGKLAFSEKKIGKAFEVVQTKFLTDVSLSAKDAKAKVWRAKIFKDSSVAWPSLVDGKVVPN